MTESRAVQHVLRRLENGVWESRSDAVVNEALLRLIVEGKANWRIPLTPAELEPFAYGFLFSAGIITAPTDIEEFLGEGLEVRIRLKEERGARALPDPEALPEPLACAARMQLPPWPQLLERFAEFESRAQLFRATGGAHSAALWDGAAILHFSEDVGRHNAIDKTIGKALLADCDFGSQFLFSSGRIAAETVSKAAWAGIPVVVSPAAATALAIERATACSITLIGFVRPARLNLYTQFVRDGR